MGDKSRALEFSLFIHRTFPDADRIADVAGGTGELSFWLGELGHTPAVVEPRDAHLPRWIRRELRKRAVTDGHLTSIERIERPVEHVDLSGFDLLVGLHPDQATEPLVRAAVAHRLPFAVVPCCVCPLNGERLSSESWLDHLASLAPESRRGTLSIEGAATVLWRTTAYTA